MRGCRRKDLHMVRRELKLLKRRLVKTYETIRMSLACSHPQEIHMPATFSVVCDVDAYRNAIHVKPQKLFLPNPPDIEHAKDGFVATLAMPFEQPDYDQLNARFQDFNSVVTGGISSSVNSS